MKSKKGVEMSMNTIIIAALALVILVVLIILLTKQTGNVDQTINSCDGRGYTCSSGTSCPSGTSLYSSRGCGDGNVCCAPNPFT